MSATDMAFRAQLVIPEQQRLFDYWRSKCQPGAIPARADIRPAEIVRLLPFISLIDVGDGVADLRVRLAGTQLREFFGREITGRTIYAIEPEARRDYWAAAYGRLLQGSPAQGILPVHLPRGDFVTRFWVRFPLSADKSNVDMILGYDAFVFASKLGALTHALGHVGQTA